MTSTTYRTRLRADPNDSMFFEIVGCKEVEIALKSAVRISKFSNSNTIQMCKKSTSPKEWKVGADVREIANIYFPKIWKFGEKMASSRPVRNANAICSQACLFVFMLLDFWTITLAIASKCTRLSRSRHNDFFARHFFLVRVISSPLVH